MHYVIFSLAILLTPLTLAHQDYHSYLNSHKDSDATIQSSIDQQMAIAGIKAITYLENKQYTKLINYLTQLNAAFIQDISKEQLLSWEIYSIYHSRKDLAGFLDQFVEQHPKHFIPYLLRGTYYTGQGWTKRGGSYHSETHDEKLSGMEYFHTKAFPDLNQAILLNPDFMHSYLIRAALFRPRKQYVDAMWADIDAAYKLQPASFDVWTQFLNATLPRWYGSEELLQQALASSQLFVVDNPKLKGMNAFVARNEAEKYWYADKKTQALEKYLQAESLGEHIWVTSEVARVYLELGVNNDEGCRYTDKAIQLEPYGWRTHRFLLYCERHRLLGHISKS